MSDEPDSSQTLSSLDCWDYTVELECMQGNPDLQLAAELGKSLLERNKQLEAVLREHQLVIDDQALEIEYHTKQTRALREAYDSRLKIYEQLDISIQDLERANHRLLLDSSADKKQIRSLKETIDVLEGKCDKLEENIKDLNSQINILKKRLEKNDLDKENTSNRTETILSDSENGLEDNGAFCPYTKEKGETECTTTKNPVSSTPIRFNGQVVKGWDETDDQSEEMAELLAELSKYRSQCRRGERRIGDLEEQLSTLIRDNTALENQLATLSLRNDEGMKSIHDEIVSLEEVRQGHMCSRCLGNIHDNDSEIPGDDDSSMMDELMTSTHRASFSVDVQAHIVKESSPSNKYSTMSFTDLLQKYEALEEVHRKSLQQANCLSLQEEIQMCGEFNNMSTKDTDDESGHGDSLKLHKKTRKTFSTPTDFSEAETSSSGFADETSNKGTQTEGIVGSFLCTIADGEGCKLSIYNDASPIDSRFRDRPEYRDLFKEIFNILKNEDKKKAEGDKLPYLDDCTDNKVSKAPMFPPPEDKILDFPDDDCQSIISSTMSELSTTQSEPTPIIEKIILSENVPTPELQPENKGKQETVLRRLVKQKLDDYIVQGSKRSSRRKNKIVERSDSPITHIIGCPTISYSSRPNCAKKRRDISKLGVNVDLSKCNNRNLTASPTPSQGSTKYKSSASQELHKLKKLDLSYAQVLRTPDNKNTQFYRHRRR